MIETQWQKEALAIRRDYRDMQAAGWEYVGESGGNLWKLYRGAWTDRHISEAKVARDGRGVWVKIVPND